MRPRPASAALLLPCLLSLGLLSACKHGSSAADVFTPGNVYGDSMPGAATELTPDEFAAQVKSGELTLMTAADRAAAGQAADAQYAEDRAFLEGLGSPSEALALLLAPKTDVTVTAGRDLLATMSDGKGGTFQVLTLGDELMARAAVKGYETSQDPANALAVYALAWATLDAAQQAQLPAPESLAGAALATVQAALDALNTLLEGQGDPVHDALALRDITIIDDGRGAGNGTDEETCGDRDPDGLYRRLSWPLKTFLPPIKQQSPRGTCWAFASIGAIETRERVVNDRAVNLSEQYAVNVHKRDALLDIDFLGEGDVNYWMLDKFVERDWPIAFETEWTYNPGTGRMPPESLSGSCTNYSGYCSESNHQSPTVCARVRADIFCGYYTIHYQGASSIRADHARQLWLNFFATAPVALMRQLIANGQPLMASFTVLHGFDYNDRGYVTDFDTRSRGGHYVQLVGYAPDSAVPFAPTVPEGTGGGFFIAKNSWGCAGDGGYYYLPVSYIQRFFTDVSVLESSASRSQAWMDTLDSLRPPTVSLATIGGGTTVPLNRDFSVTATVAGGGPSCCDLQWTPTPNQTSGNTAVYHFMTTGPQTFTVTASNAFGQTATASLQLEVVNTPPVAHIEQPGSGVVYQYSPVSFVGFGMDANEGAGPGDGRIYNCTWTSSDVNFTTSSLCATNHAFNTTGTRTVTLTITDGWGLTGQASVTLDVQVPPTNFPPTASFTVTPSVSSTPFDWNTQLTFTGNATDPEGETPFTYHWTAAALSDTGVEGTPLELGTTATVTWTPANNYNFFYGSGACQTATGQWVRVHLGVTDTGGLTGPASHDLWIVCPPG